MAERWKGTLGEPKPQDLRVAGEGPESIASVRVRGGEGVRGRWVVRVRVRLEGEGGGEGCWKGILTDVCTDETVLIDAEDEWRSPSRSAWEGGEGRCVVRGESVR